MFCSKGRITLQRYQKTITPLRERILLVELLHAGYSHAHSTNRGHAFLTFSFSFSLSRPVWPGLSWARSGSCRSWGSFAGFVHVKAEWIRTPDSSSGVSDQQSVGSSPGLDTCVLIQDTCPTVFKGPNIVPVWRPGHTGHDNEYDKHARARLVE